MLLLAGGVLAVSAAEPPRAARSVRLHFAAPDGDLFYNEVTVEQTTGGSYFMACGWNTGYFGMQQLGSPTNKVVIFSVWDPTKGDDANKVPLEQRVEILYEGVGSKIKRFGGEGTGGQCLWPYPWATNETCRFAVRAKVEGDTTSYAGWFFDNRAKVWRHLVTFRTRTEGKPLRGYYSFIEDFQRDGRSANEVRRANFENGWVRDLKGEWVPLQRATFTASDAEWESKENIDAGISMERFYLGTGGSTVRTHELGKTIERAPAASGRIPELPEELIGTPAAEIPPVPGVVIDHRAAATKQFIGSPSFAVLPKGDYLASHDFFGAGSTLNRTVVFGSEDRGQTWKQRCEITGQYWSTLFVQDGALYLMGTSREYGFAVIRRSLDGGRTWTVPKDSDTGLLLGDGRYHCAPVPVVLHAGRLWRGMEDGMGPGGWGKEFHAFMMSVPEYADLLKATNWTCSSRLDWAGELLGGKFGGWLEGNAVATPEGKMVDMLRADFRGLPEKAAIIEISDDGTRASFNPTNGFVDFPGGCKKFTIRYDEHSRQYWSLVNHVPPQHAGRNTERARNTLALTSSSDLRQWTVRSIVLYHPDPEKHAFQYADWQFDGDDLILVSRTAFDDAEGGAAVQHDANFLTFHRVKNFRSLTMADSPATLRQASEH